MANTHLETQRLHRLLPEKYRAMLGTRWRCLAGVKLVPIGGDRFLVAADDPEERDRLLREAMKAARLLETDLAGLERQALLAVPSAQAEGLAMKDVAESLNVTRQAAASLLDQVTRPPDDRTFVGYKKFHSTGEVVAIYQRNMRSRGRLDLDLPTDSLVDYPRVEMLLDRIATLVLIQGMNDEWFVAGDHTDERREALLAALDAIAELSGMIVLAEDRLVRLARSSGISVAEIADALGLSRQAVGKRLAPPKSEAHSS